MKGAVHGCFFYLYFRASPLFMYISLAPRYQNDLEFNKQNGIMLVMVVFVVYIDFNPQRSKQVINTSYNVISCKL